MADWTRTTRRALLLVGAVLAGAFVALGGVSSTAGLADGDSGFPAFAFDFEITVPTVTFDAPVDAGNETTPRPGVSPLPVVPDDGHTSDDGVGYAGHYRQS